MTKIIFSHVDCKRAYRFFLFRESLLKANSSGLHTLASIRESLSISPTMCRDFKHWCRLGLIQKKGRYVKLNRLCGIAARLHRLYKAFKSEIERAEDALIYFADLYKKRILYGNVIAQAHKELQKISDTGTAIKYKRHVTNNKTFVGVKQGIFLAYSTIARIIGKSRTTGHRTIKRMRIGGMIKSKRQIQFTGYYAADFENYRKSTNQYGRLEIRNGLIYKRLPNSYCFL